MSVGKRPLRIVMFVENNTYPFDPRVRQEADALADAGYKVTVVCPRKKGQTWSETINGVRVLRFPRPPDGHGLMGYLAEFGYATLAGSLLVLWKMLVGGLDVVHVHNPPDTLFVSGLIPKLFGKKFIFDHHDLSGELYLSKYDGDFAQAEKSKVYKMLLRLEKWSCKLADWVIEVNESYKQIDVERNGVNPDRVCVIRNGPDLRRMKLVPPDPELRAKASTIFGYVGNIAHQDGLDHVLRALNNLRNDLGQQDFYCVIIGRVDDPAPLKKLTDDLNLTDRVWFTGYIPDDKMLSYLSTADICIVPDPPNPLNNKSTMNKVMEYMALGKPVVAYDLVEHRVSAEGAALYAKPGDTLDMARQFKQLMDHPELRTKLGQIGRQRIEQQLAWTYSAEKLRRFYAMVDAVVKGEPVPSMDGLKTATTPNTEKISS